MIYLCIPPNIQQQRYAHKDMDPVECHTQTGMAVCCLCDALQLTINLLLWRLRLNKEKKRRVNETSQEQKGMCNLSALENNRVQTHTQTRDME